MASGLATRIDVEAERFGPRRKGLLQRRAAQKSRSA